MRPEKIFLLGVLLTLGVMAGCASPRVTRTEVEKTIDLSGRWNDTDSRLVSEEMIKDCLARPWINTFNEKYRRDPVVIVGTVINRSHEHIDAQLFIKDLEKNILNSGKVKFVASRQERPELREEREEQKTGYTEPETIKPKGRETGADFMVQGTINSIKDEIKGKYVILYQINLELVDLTNNQKVWIGQKEIKKVVGKSKYSL
jgi:uncharacterized protein (TIGR02722 family)